MPRQRLTIIPSVPLWKDGDSLLFDRKFYDGLAMYGQYWTGDLACILSSSKSELPAFGLVTKKHEDLPFKCTVLDEGELVTSEHLRGTSIVLASADASDQLHLSALCRRLGIKCIYVIEYVPETRYQIASLSTRNPLIRLRRLFYIWNEERRRRAAFRVCDGLQSNGTAAYREYESVENKLLYFDTRVRGKDIITDAKLEERLSVLARGTALRLAFSGRLIRMKGADHLIRLAGVLNQRQIRFHLTIYGSGDLEGEMRKDIQRNALEGKVAMPGAVDFYDRLLPDLKEKIDLFVCLHRQSDPSCTYLETLSCGIPIVGYANRAFAGLMEISKVGWEAGLDDVAGIAALIEGLDKRRA